LELWQICGIPLSCQGQTTILNPFKRGAQGHFPLKNDGKYLNGLRKYLRDNALIPAE
jgi:hypothetical protein